MPLETKRVGDVTLEEFRSYMNLCHQATAFLFYGADCTPFLHDLYLVSGMPFSKKIESFYEDAYKMTLEEAFNKMTDGLEEGSLAYESWSFMLCYALSGLHDYDYSPGRILWKKINGLWKQVDRSVEVDFKLSLKITRDEVAKFLNHQAYRKENPSTHRHDDLMLIGWEA